MRIFTVWSNEGVADGDMPWLVDAVDEYTIENLGDMPDKYKAAALRPCSKELIINIPELAVRHLFETTEVEGEV